MLTTSSSTHPGTQSSSTHAACGGPAEYDWAFWCLYYLETGFDGRIDLLGSLLVDTPTVLRWVAVLAADGLRYHLRISATATADRLDSIINF